MGYLEAVQYLLASNVSPRTKDANGITPLMCAQNKEFSSIIDAINQYEKLKGNVLCFLFFLYIKYICIDIL